MPFALFSPSPLVGEGRGGGEWSGAFRLLPRLRKCWIPPPHQGEGTGTAAHVPRRSHAACSRFSPSSTRLRASVMMAWRFSEVILAPVRSVT